MLWEALAGTVGSFEGPIRQPIEMTVKGNRSGFRIPGLVEMRQTPIKDVVSGTDHLAGPEHPGCRRQQRLRGSTGMAMLPP